MEPIAIDFGGFALRWYGVMAALGFLAATLAVNANRKIVGISADRAAGIVMTGMITGIIGARIFYVFRFFEHFRDDPWRIIRLDQGGLVFFGGFLAIPAIWLYCRYWKLDFIRILDLAGPALTIGHAFGRVGCFLNGCCYGSPSGCFPGVVYPVGSEPFRCHGETPLHPVQLYEAGLNVLLFLFLFWLLRRSRRGVTMSAYFIGYGVIRFVDEFLRGDPLTRWYGLTQSQLIGLFLIPAGVLLLVWFQRRKAPVHD